MWERRALNGPAWRLSARAESELNSLSVDGAMGVKVAQVTLFGKRVSVQALAGGALALIRAENSRRPGGPTGPLRTP